MKTGWSGLFGKTPETGDFVVRDLPSTVRRGMDAWLSVHLATRRGAWPGGGVRALVQIADTPVLLCAVASQDAAGRRYPLAAATDGRGLSLEVAEAWCDRVAPCLEQVAAGEAGLQEISALLQELPQLPRDVDDGMEAIWCRGGTPLEIDEDALDEIFSSA